ncbi:zinc-ribbon domain-containing protein [Pseudooceanicola sp.]|uniref:zinc-ribbon domain-containing protein n=1 Tax=Pseudooceanicola sp. TaxID=1914328 RepID=UPI003515A6A6
MRITCPNCGAQYEVPDDVIPDEGRDVQCSNCGDTWFQTRSEQYSLDELPEDDSDADVAADSLAEAEAEDSPDPAEAEVEATGVPAKETGKRGIDPAVANILQEEAQHEARLRAAESSTLESQGDLGLESLPPDGASQRAREARERMDRLRGHPDPAAAETAADTPAEEMPRSRSRLLPDVEEVSSSLRPDETEMTAETAPEIEVDEPARRGGFARGFGFVVLIVVVLIVVYANEGTIVSAVPTLEPGVSAYTDQVDKLRIWLDARLSGFIPE